MSPEDQYPSTIDAEGESGVKACLVASRRRVDEGWTRDTYVDESRGQFCAVGAVFATDGVSADQVSAALECADGRGLAGGEWYQMLAEERLSQTARDAIDLLNQVAAERHPDVDRHDNWSGMLEWVNQSWHPPGGHYEVKAEVLAIYDEAIRRAA